MIRVADAVAELVKQSPLVAEGLARGLINITALARELQPRVEKRVYKPVTLGAIVMALKRLSATLNQTTPSSKIFRGAPDMVVRSNLFECTVANSASLLHKQPQLAALAAGQGQTHFLTITAGVFETTIIASSALNAAVHTILADEQIVTEIPNLSSITIRLTSDILEIPGSYAQILKRIAWEGINIIEVVSTYLELTVILRQDDTDRAFSALKGAFR